ncbi:MAG TPA: hypothetical protein O0Y08_01885 [Methanocorpusculum sp.]|nr:DNA replication complex GINS family protein [Methanocorpusculum sp.]HJJ44883.1 hypothetical protein [Methanocorpusculum sp.]HJJ58142.1 hypothetical protein [Methanocorpusculum sp.]HJJ59598.1 hypothetical protein [Methanocorpusculum sp.]
MARLTISDLHGYLLDERSTGSLCEIPATLYEETAAEIENLRVQVTSIKDPFSEGVQSLIKERESLREFLRGIYMARTKKIIDMASAASNGEEIDRNSLRMMVAGERALYNVVLESCTSCRKALLEGKQIIEVTAYNYAAPEVPAAAEASPAAPANPADEEEFEEFSEIPTESEASRAENAPDPYRVVAVRSKLSEFQDLNGRIYSLSPGDVVSLPSSMADILCKDNKALSIRIR